ncbi:hypothetical protein PHYBLDRAFT_60773 [Phycomyces blakesleeanus NRRL 1555(-)]|uniref:Uncharacterized protein n=1 Tax=Phycomyces blakesleeanus (strain ATCC 8743b / DSM 1359 / FGSC 10004 / NBRC 33097 / NRRL 1555) TaxID=763407 RepID=A0A162Y0S0_PHYB8|nr:hypothetical protein PHYBLDRAFT_60773 [Phycomyces blakesleeanus NRRL 1555(-)]OAD77645.1 hypothetical protein PHYBLDRAFT_60773 [Phycomyces blakesleeanus NRRL 1555(-)]|eukprot:XP_018295685.1 hypothetical protein PHYBLDRAFT_60773 [Phycomyces blakesleeanus NRRL 1555(-)]
MYEILVRIVYEFLLSAFRVLGKGLGAQQFLYKLGFCGLCFWDILCDDGPFGYSGLSNCIVGLMCTWFLGFSNPSLVFRSRKNEHFEVWYSLYIHIWPNRSTFLIELFLREIGQFLLVPSSVGCSKSHLYIKTVVSWSLWEMSGDSDGDFGKYHEHFSKSRSESPLIFHSGIKMVLSNGNPFAMFSDDFGLHLNTIIDKLRSLKWHCLWKRKHLPEMGLYISSVK